MLNSCYLCALLVLMLSQTVRNKFDMLIFKYETFLFLIMEIVFSFNNNSFNLGSFSPTSSSDRSSACGVE